MSIEDSKTISNRVAQVLQNIEDAATKALRKPSSIQLLAVSKKQPIARIQAAYNSGLRDFGENYLQGLQAHTVDLPTDVRWHFIGHIQSKKAKHLHATYLIHSLDSLKVAKGLSLAAQNNQKTTQALIHVNISEQHSKSGILPSTLAKFLDEVAQLPAIGIQGLMCIPNPNKDCQSEFSSLRKLQEKAQVNTDFHLKDLSMGMSNSYEEAIAQGATIVRVGTAIFGAREEK